MPKLLLPLLILPMPALAHPGHLIEASGHNHWVAGAALGAAIAVGVWGLIKGRKDKGEQTEPDAEPQEA